MTSTGEHLMIPRLLLASALLLAGSFPTFAQSSGTADAAVAKQVIDAEHAWAAAFQGCKPDALATLTTDDFSYTDFNGMTYSRAWFMKTARECTHNVVRIEPMFVNIDDG